MPRRLASSLALAGLVWPLLVAIWCGITCLAGPASGATRPHHAACHEMGGATSRLTSGDRDCREHVFMPVASAAQAIVIAPTAPADREIGGAHGLVADGARLSAIPPRIRPPASSQPTVLRI